MDKELSIAQLERQQDAKDGKIPKHTFDPDRPSIYDTATSKGVEKALRYQRRRIATESTRSFFTQPVTKTSSQGHRLTTSYTKQRPAYTTSDDRHAPVVVETPRRRSRTPPTRRSSARRAA